MTRVRWRLTVTASCFSIAQDGPSVRVLIFNIYNRVQDVHSKFE